MQRRLPVMSMESLNPLGFPVELFDYLAEIVLADVDDPHFAGCVLWGIAGVGCVDHHGLTEFPANRTRRGFGGIGGAQHITDFSYRLNAFVGPGDAFFRAGLVGLAD